MFCHSMQCSLYISNFQELKQSKQASYFRCLWWTWTRITNVEVGQWCEWPLATLLSSSCWNTFRAILIPRFWWKPPEINYVGTFVLSSCNLSNMPFVSLIHFCHKFAIQPSRERAQWHLGHGCLTEWHFPEGRGMVYWELCKMSHF
jgi:hypothetical protein